MFRICMIQGKNAILNWNLDKSINLLRVTVVVEFSDSQSRVITFHYNNSWFIFLYSHFVKSHVIQELK